ncbi:hypothetical protein [Micromonospora sp. KC721]|uniref:hypothetical protein n=1 Tax=Micromonospora sp. KC721 TaxID=2530380 RepID=UPI00104D3196|nr:hypothetical protein [Micromonospora sp. KC721]TDB82284.1 hypothetical protein E1182_02335 [Micromonospora sp. KC721]
MDVLTRSLALLLGGRGITVAPGITHTAMNAWLRDNEPGQRAVAAMTALGGIVPPGTNLHNPNAPLPRVH